MSHRIGEFIILGSGEGPELDGVPHGDWQYRADRIFGEGRFERGVAEGRWCTFWGNGALHEEIEVSGGVPHGPYRSHDPRGEVVLEEGVFERGRRTGPWVRRHGNGVPRELGRYRDGKRHGPWLRWHDNEQKAAELVYRRGAIVSVREWDEWGEALEPVEKLTCKTCKKRQTEMGCDRCGAPLCQPCARTDRFELGYELCPGCA